MMFPEQLSSGNTGIKSSRDMSISFMKLIVLV